MNHWIKAHRKKRIGWTIEFVFEDLSGCHDDTVPYIDDFRFRASTEIVLLSVTLLDDESDEVWAYQPMPPLNMYSGDLFRIDFSKLML